MANRRRTIGAWAAGAIIGAAALIAGPAGALAPAASAQAAQARAPVVAEPQTFNFGVSDPNDIVDATFTLRNNGSRPVVIREVKPACKCTVPTLPTNVIPPGQSIDISASLDLRGSLGPAKKEFSIFFEGYGAPLVCAIEGVLTYAVAVEPVRPNLGTSLRGTVRLQSADGRPFRVLSVHGKEPRVVRQYPPGGSRAIWFDVMFDARTPRDAVGPSVAAPFMMLVRTDHPDAAVLDVRFGGSVAATPEQEYIMRWRDILVQRRNVNLGVLEPGEPATFQTVVTRPAEVHHEPATASIEGEDLEVRVTSVEPVDGRDNDETYTVEVTYTGERSGALVLAPIYFETLTTSGERTRSRLWAGGYTAGAPDDAGQ